MAVDVVAVGIDLLHDFIAHRGCAKRNCDHSLSLSKQIKAAAKKGCPYAKRVVSSGILNDPQPPRACARRTAHAVPKLTPNQLERERLNSSARGLMEHDKRRGLLTSWGAHRHKVRAYEAAAHAH